jgi:hypothetical protein
MPNERWRAVSLCLLLGLASACATNYDHSIALVSCDGATIEVIERYRRAGFSGHTGLTRYVLVVKVGRWWWNRKEIDITPVDTVDLSVLERTLPPAERWQPLAPHEKASRRLFVSPKEFSAGEYDSISACLARQAGEINRRFAIPRPPVEYFEGDGFRDRRAGLRSIAYRVGDWNGNPCQMANTVGFRLRCAGLAGFVSVDGYGQAQFCLSSDPVMPCGRHVGRVSADGTHATVRPPSPTPRCAQGALNDWLGDDRMRFTHDCRLPSGESLADLFTLRESENLE